MAATHSFGFLPAITLVVILTFSFGIVSIKGDKKFVEYICKKTSEEATCLTLLRNNHHFATVSQIQEHFLWLGQQITSRLSIVYRGKKESGSCSELYDGSSNKYEEAINNYNARRYELVRKNLNEVHKLGTACLLETSFTKEIDNEVKIATLNLEILKLGGHHKRRNGGR